MSNCAVIDSNNTVINIIVAEPTDVPPEGCTLVEIPFCDIGYTWDGTFQQYAVASARHLSIIPDELDLETASPLLCAGVTVYRAVKEAGLVPGQDVVIIGSGGAGVYD